MVNAGPLGQSAWATQAHSLRAHMFRDEPGRVDAGVAVSTVLPEVSPGAGENPLVVGLGGTLRSDSSTERALRYCLEAVRRQGGRTVMLCGEDLDLPMYAPEAPTRTEKAGALVAALRGADAVIVGSPGYHGAVSGLVKNALDYVEDLRDDSRVYLENRSWGCISCAYGWQAAVGTMGQLRVIGHALRAWPTPQGVAINSAERIWDSTGELIDPTVRSQLERLAVQVLAFPLIQGRPV